MASVFSIRVLLFLYICSSSIFIVNAVTRISFIDNNNKDLIFRRFKDSRSLTKLDWNSFEESPSSSWLDIKRRNVILPRICYYARISGTGSHQKLCLPYNDSKRS